MPTDKSAATSYQDELVFHEIGFVPAKSVLSRPSRRTVNQRGKKSKAECEDLRQPPAACDDPPG
jgi:hypothetical protein